VADLALIIKVLGDKAPLDSAKQIAAALSPNLREIIRLQNTCIGTINEVPDNQSHESAN